MSTAKISQLTQVPTLLPTAEIEIEQAAASYRATLQEVYDIIPLLNTRILVGNAANVAVGVAMSGDATISNTGALTIANSAITNAKVSATAGIVFSKMVALTASRALVTDGTGFIVVSAVTSTELGYLDGVTSAIQTQLDGKEASLGFTPENVANKGAVSGYAGLDSSQLLELANFPSGTGLQVLRRNAGNTALEFATISGGGGITSINSDTDAAQIIAGTADRITVTDVTNTHTINIAAGYVGQASITTLGTIATGVWNATAIAYAKLTLTDSIVNADINTAAAIAFSKLASLTDGNILVGSGTNVATSVAVTGDVLISNSGVTSINTGVIVNADISGSAAINATKIHDGSVDNTEFGYLNGVTSAIQTQIDSKLSLTLTSAFILVGNGSNVATGVAVTGDISIDNTGLTAIASGVIVNGDVNTSAAIDYSKLAALTVSRALVSDGSGFVSVATTTATEIGYVNGVTSAIQTQLNAKAPLASPTFTGTVTTAALDVAGNNIDNIQNLIHDQSVITYNATLAFDFDLDQEQTLAVTGNLTTLTTSNRAAGKSKTIFITGDTVNRTLTFNTSWRTNPSDATVTITANTFGILTFGCKGTAETDVFCAYAEFG